MSRRRIRLAISATLLFAIGCATDEGGAESSSMAPTRDAPPAAAEPMEHSTLAVQAVHVGGQMGSIEPELTTLFRDAVARTSGIPCVDEHMALDALENCSSPPCESEELNAFRSADVDVHMRLGPVNDQFQASAFARRRAEVLARTSALAPSPQQAVERAAWKLGEALRAKLAP